MKKLLLTISALCLIWLTACEKDDKGSGFHSSYVPTFSDRVFLQATKNEDNTVTLNWTKIDSDNFYQYIVLRDVSNDSSDLNYYDAIAYIGNQNKLNYRDTALPYSSNIKYQIAVDGSGMIYSNLAFVTRDDVHTMYINDMFDILLDKQNDKLYVLDQDYDNGYKNDIIAYDYDNFVEINRLELDHGFTYSDIGIYNSQTELYIASEESIGGVDPVYIYNADNLNHTATLLTNTAGLKSVTYNNGKLFTCEYEYDEGIVSYSRSGLNQIGATGDTYCDYRIKAIPGTNTEIIGVGLYNSNIANFNFDANGNGISYNENYSGYYYGNFFEIAPSGSYFISGSYSYLSIYNKNLEYICVLDNPNYNYYEAIAIDNNDNIYAAYEYSNTIEVFDYPSNTLVNTFNSVGYPAKIFIDNEKLYSLTKTQSNSDLYVIETFEIN